MAAYKLRSILLSLLLGTTAVSAQHSALKTNLLQWATTTPNASAEFALGRQFSIEIGGSYNAWKFGNGMKLNLYMARPEIRYWFCRKFEGHFLGVHGHYGHFNIGQIPFLPSMKDFIYRGDFYGGGLSYGYHWALGRRWGIEAVVGGGYINMKYGKYSCVECAEKVGDYKQNYFGVTQAAINLIYFIK